jgi:hypothetical protein
VLLVHRLERHRPDPGGLGTDLSWEELELMVKRIIGESFVPKSLILSQDILALCNDPGLRSAVLATLPTLDESDMAVHQTGGRDPHHGIWISDASAGGPQSAGVAPSAPAPWTRAKGLQAVPPPQVAPGGRRKRGDAGCAALTGHLFQTPPEASEDCWWGRGGRLPGPGHAEARQSSATTTIGSAATTTTTIVGSAAATTTWG